MTTPINREQFAKYCLRKLGAPVMRIRVTDEQVSDRIDEALKKYMEFHYDGTEKVYIARQLDAGDVASKSITMDESIVGVVDVFDMGFSTGVVGGLNFNVPYQILMSEIFGSMGVGSGTLSSYVVTRSDLETIRMFLVGKFPIRYSRHTNVLYLDVSPEKLQVGNYVIIDAYRWNNPEVFPDIWNDYWLQKYATALIKKQWGTNMSAFGGMALPGGITVPGERIHAEAEIEIEKLEQELTSNYSAIIHDMIG